MKMSSFTIMGDGDQFKINKIYPRHNLLTSLFRINRTLYLYQIKILRLTNRIKWCGLQSKMVRNKLYHKIYTRRIENFFAFRKLTTSLVYHVVSSTREKKKSYYVKTYSSAFCKKHQIWEWNSICGNLRTPKSYT